MPRPAAANILNDTIRTRMYLPSHFEETRPEVLHALMRARPLATLVTNGADGPQADHIPLLLDSAAGVLRGHVARANPLWRDLPAASDTLAIFQGEDAYISPSWYPSKQEHGKAVPTWNYVVVQAYGPLRSIDDPLWLRGFLRTLTTEHETGMAQPWAIDDAPPDYIEKMLAAIVGIELRITRLSGKWKVSQNQSAANRQGVAQGLNAIARPGMAALAVDYSRGV